jgi:nucleotide sugar dehydrogenase
MLKITIIGHGFVGKAIDYAFQDDVEKQIIDPKYDVHLHDVRLSADVTFVCVPTPMHEHGQCDVSILQDVLKKIAQRRSGLIVVKSTVPPDQIENLFRGSAKHRMVYNPEFLTEKNANEDIINPFVHIFGGDNEATEKLERFYKEYSICKPCPVSRMSATDASFVKYGINTFLATKLTFFNEFYDAIKNFGGNYGRIANAIGTDPRIGHSHTRVPGFDGKRGFGGACFPKDVSAFINFTTQTPLLEYVMDRNNQYRSEYEKDDREIEQNIQYDMTGQTAHVNER